MKEVTEKYFLKRGFKQIKNNLFMIEPAAYLSFGVFEENMVVRLLNDGHTWRLSIMPEIDYDPYSEIDLLEFCNINVFEDFTARLLIEFKQQ